MDADLDNASSDAEAILACLSSLAIFTLHANRMAQSYTSLANSKDEEARASGRHLLQQCAEILKETRERMDGLMNDFGDWFNGGDACSETMTTFTATMYDMLHKRRNGDSFNT